MAVCKQCGKEITEPSHHSGRERIFCNNDCYRAYRDIVEWKYTTCQYCGKVFKEQRERANLYCSQSCAAKFGALLRSADIEKDPFEDEAEEHDAELLREYREAVQRVEELRYRLEHEKICAVCGSRFMAKTARQVCCTPECSKKRDNARHDKRLSRNGKPDKSITLSRLYRRDGGVCQICGRHLDFELDPNDSDYPSIDHIIPLAKGGLHSWDNVQLACRRCNWEKGDTLPSPGV